MSVCLQFDGKAVVPFGSRDDVQSVADWAAECEEYAPDVVKLFEDGASHDIGGLTEQIAKAKACNAPDERTGRHVVKLLRTLEESNALSVDLVEDDDSPSLESVAIQKAVTTSLEQSAAMIKAVKDTQDTLVSMMSRMQSQPVAAPLPNVTLNVPKAELQFPDQLQKFVAEAFQQLAIELAGVVSQCKAAVVNVEPTPVNMPVPVLTLDTSLTQVVAEALERIVAAIGSIKLVVNVPKPELFGIAITRDPETGLATRFDQVAKG